MLLLNIETLTDTELRYIAKQEDIEDWETLDREDLIESIKDVYDDDIQTPEEGSDRHKFVKGITDLNSDFLQLPGVDPLPEAYNRTFVHLVLRDYNWAYAFWSISITKMRKLEESKTKLKLRLRGKKNSYDIDVSINDNNWNLELPWPGETYVLDLISDVDGEEVLASSNKAVLNPIYFTEHADELKDENMKCLLVKSMMSKEGSLISNKQVREIMAKAEEAM